MNRGPKELLIWIISALISIALWYPVFSKINYLYTISGILQLVIVIQLFRWFVFYDNVILFRKGWMKILFILISFTYTAIHYAMALDVIRIFDDQSLPEICTNWKEAHLGLQETYDLFEYLRHMTMVCMFGLLATTAMIILKIIYRTIGYGNQKVRAFIGRD